MPIALKRSRLTRAVVTTVAVAGASLAVLPAPSAQAAPADYTLQWGVSQYLNEHLTSQLFSNGATENATTGVVTFTGGTGWHNGSSTSMQYTGTARYAFVQGSTEIYSLTFKDPLVTVDGTGEGKISADVSWAVPSQSVSGAVTDTVVTTFAATAGSWSGDVLSGTPRWAGVAATDEYGAGKPADGKSWTVPFVKALPSSLNPFFYASGSANDFKKPPAAFVAMSSSTPTVAVTTTSASPTAGLGLKVDGVNFNPTTQTGDAGIYVGLAPSDAVIDYSDMSAMDKFAAVDWVMPSQFTSGAFSKALTAPTAKLDPTKSYSIFTWQAHTHSNTSQDTKTPVTINWSALAAPAAKQASTVLASFNKAPKANKKAEFAVTVSGGSATPTGTVVVTLARKGTSTTKSVSSALVGGAALFQLPKFKPGKWTLTTTYAGDSALTASQTTTTVKVKKVKKPKKK